MSPSTDETRARVLALLKRWGWNSTSFQSLGTGFRYWFDSDGASDSGCVAYVDTGGAWVVGGAPICAPERLGEVALRFVAAARAAGKRASFFGVETRLVRVGGLEGMPIGEQPVWDPGGWGATLAATASLRQQLRRAQHKGVTVRQVSAAGLPRARPAIEALIARWLDAKPMAPMGFLVEVQPFELPDERRYFVAERAGEVVGFLAAVPVYSRDGWLVEHFLRDPHAPNGTPELLIDAAMTALAAGGSRYVTLGLAPLSGPLPRWLRAARRLSAPLYDFRGLRAFKAKLRPDRWEPIYLAHPVESSGHLALLDALAAFARGSLVRFGVDTLKRALQL